MIEERTDRRWPDVVREAARTPVTLAPRVRLVVQALDLRIGLCAPALDDRLRRLVQTLERGRCFVLRSGVVERDDRDRPAGKIGRVLLVGPSSTDDIAEAHRPRRICEHAPERIPESQRVLRAVDPDAAGHVRPKRMETELEGRYDTEVRACAAHGPEQLGLFLLARAHETPVGGDELHGDQVVDRQPERALESPDAAAEREPGNTRVPYGADRADKPVLLGTAIEIDEVGAAIRPSGPRRGVHGRPTHARHVEDHAAVARREAVDAVAAAADGQREALVAREPNRRRDIVDLGRPHDERGPPVVQRAPHPTRIVVAGVGRLDDLAFERRAELIDRRGGERHRVPRQRRPQTIPGQSAPNRRR